MKTLDEILLSLDTIAQFAEVVPQVTIPATIADKLIKVAQAAIAAHVAATGKPWDASLLAPVLPA